MLKRLKQGWSGVGPTIRNGNRFSSIARAANVVTYGEWMYRKKSGKINYIAGYNSAFSREVLLSRSTKLKEDLIATSLMQRSLSKQGHSFFLEERAIMYHWEASYWWGTKRILFPNGQALGTLRSRDWTPLKRLCFSALIPGLFLYRYTRALNTYFRIAKKNIIFEELFYLFPITLIWTFGELKGYWNHGNGVYKKVSDVERNRSPLISQEEAIQLPKSRSHSISHD
jgi:hypothetical protein